MRQERSQDGSWGRLGIKGWKLGAFRGQKRVNGGHASESGNKGEACGTVGVKSKESGTRRRFGKGAPGPAFPAPSLTSANSALLLPSTSANRRAPGHVTTRPRLSASHRSLCFARGRQGRGSAIFHNCPMEGAPMAEGGRALG